MYMREVKSRKKENVIIEHEGALTGRFWVYPLLLLDVFSTIFYYYDCTTCICTSVVPLSLINDGFSKNVFHVSSDHPLRAFKKTKYLFQAEIRNLIFILF